jgi:hypothetical protein
MVYFLIKRARVFLPSFRIKQINGQFILTYTPVTRQRLNKHVNTVTDEYKLQIPFVAQIGTNVRVRGFNAGLLARSQFASYTNITLTSGRKALFMGDMGEGALHREERN